MVEKRSLISTAYTQPTISTATNHLLRRVLLTIGCSFACTTLNIAEGVIILFPVWRCTTYFIFQTLKALASLVMLLMVLTTTDEDLNVKWHRTMWISISGANL